MKIVRWSTITLNYFVKYASDSLGDKRIIEPIELVLLKFQWDDQRHL